MKINEKKILLRISRQYNLKLRTRMASVHWAYLEQKKKTN